MRRRRRQAPHSAWSGLRLGLSQAQLAERAHLARVTVGALERGENVPQLGTAQRLAEVLGVEIEDLFP